MNLDLRTNVTKYYQNANINVNFSFKLYFMGQNRLKMGFSNLSVLQKGLLNSGLVYLD